jgi:ArsR family transcriptional regulator
MPTTEKLMSDRAAFIDFAPAATEIEADAELWSEAFDLLHAPTQLVARLRDHVRYIWEQFLAEEWERALPALRESVEAFSRINMSNLTLYEAIRTVTGRDMRGKFTAKEDTVERIVFVPSPHLGPYVSRVSQGSTMYMGYGARLPRGAQTLASPLSRSELLIRMNALADDTRLRILEMLTEREELCAQEIIETLGLSQSSVSRHLSQLSATGLLSERRREVSKCYSLNTERIVDTVRALTNFLSRR